MVRVLAASQNSKWFGALCFAALMVFAWDASAAIVRSVNAVPSGSSTRVVVGVEGDFRYRARSSENGRALHVEIESATLDESVPQLIPVAGVRVAGVVVQADADSRVVRVSVDIAGGSAPKLDAVIVGSRLILTFDDTAAGRLPHKADARGASQYSGDTVVVSGTSSVPDRRTATEANSASHASRPSQRGTAHSGPAASDDSPTGAGLATHPSSSARQASGRPVDRRSILEKPLVILDPGHGGKDPGATAWTGELEKDIVLDLAERVARRLREKGNVEVVMTRSGDRYVELADRRQASQVWGADVFVSIHANASQNSAARGIETYYHPRSSGESRKLGTGDRAIRRLARAENAGSSAPARGIGSSGVSRASLSKERPPLLDRRSESVRLAKLVQGELVRKLGMRYETVRDLGAKEGPFFVIGENAAPSVLVEAAFLTHREEGLRMRSESYREQIADGVSRGILAFLDQQRRAGAL